MKEYVGVNWNRPKQRFTAKITHKGIVYYCGDHVNQLDAVKSRDMCIIRNGLGIEKLQIIKPKKV